MNNRKLMKSLLTMIACVFALGLGTVASAQTWIELFPSGSPPDPIYVPKPAHYDAASNRLIVFFPGNPPFGGFGNQVWVLTNANGLGGGPAWINLMPTGSPPFTNGLASVVYDTATNRLIVHGGCLVNCSPALSNVFVLSNANGLGGSPVWTQSTVTNPQPRVGHSSVYDSVNNLLTSFAGHLAFFGTNQNDTSILSNANGVVSPSTWTTLATAGGPPPIRDEHTAIYDRVNNRMTIFAGEQLISTCCPYVISDYNDTWVLTNANGQGGTPPWAQLLPAGTLPSVRKAHSAIYDPMNNRMIVFGGRVWNQAAQTDTSLGDLWQLGNANGLGGAPAWTQLAQYGALPGPRFYHGTALDEANQRMIVLGGRDSTDTPSNRVWVLALNQAPVATIYLHGTGPSNNPPTLFLDAIAPTNTTAKFKDSTATNFSGGNPWKDVGVWLAEPSFTVGSLTALSDLHVWLGLKNSDDQGTNFDLRVEVSKNGVLAAAGEIYCIQGVTRNPNLAKEVIVSFAPFSPVTLNGATDELSLKVLTRIGSNGAGGFCGGHSNAVGLRLYFDSVSRPSRFNATIAP